MGTRAKFVAQFGEQEARALEEAAEYHKDITLPLKGRGSDPFKWVLATCIGFQCVEKPRFAQTHGIKLRPLTFKNWVRNHGELASHDGDVDYLALFAGKYDGFVKEEK